MKKNLILYKILLTIIIIIFTGAVYAKKEQINQVIFSNKLKQMSVLYEAFKKTGAQLVMREFTFMFQNIEKINDIEDIINKNRRICTAIALKMGMKQDEDFRIEEKSTGDIYETEYHIKKNEYISCVIRCITSIEKDGKKNSHFNVTINYLPDNNKDANFYETLISIKEYLAGMGLKPNINESIVGYFEGRPETKELNSILAELFKYMKANKNHVIKESNYVSITAYSPLIKRYIDMYGKRTNINIALRYNSYEKKTYIWLSSPVINKEY